MNFNQYISNRNGFTIFQLVVAVGLLGGVIYMGVSLLNLYARSNAKLVRDGKVEDIRRYLRTSIDCDKTVTTQTALCNSSNWVQGLAGDGSVILQKFPAISTLGKTSFEGRVKCLDATEYYKLDVQIRDSSPSNSSQRFVAWESLFPVPYVCRKPTPVTHCLVSSYMFHVLSSGGAKFPGGGATYSGNNNLVLPADATNISIRAIQIGIDDYSPSISVNGVVVYNNPEGMQGAHNIAVNFNLPLGPGANTIGASLRNKNWPSVYGLFLIVDGSYDATACTFP